MNPVLVTTSSYDSSLVAELGQEFFAKVAAQAGCAGIEIRRELFCRGDLPLAKLREGIEREKLQSVYSAPIELWLNNGELNYNPVKGIIEEALELGAQLIKTSLGHYQPHKSKLAELDEMLKTLKMEKQGLKLSVENDQTLHGGNVQTLKRFFEDCKFQNIPVGMTFDIGNWEWTEEDATEAAITLGQYVIYIHLKCVERRKGRLVTLPLPSDKNARWRSLISYFPQGIPRVIEFPLQGEKLEVVTGYYVNLLINAK